MESIQVIIADDHPIIRSGVRGVLEMAGDIKVLGEASTGKEAIERVVQMRPDILILDMALPDMNGMSVVEDLVRTQSAVKILVLSAFDDLLYIRNLLEMGVAGYLLKDEAPGVIVDAVHGVARGEQGWVSRKIAAKMSTWVRRDQQKRIKFTRREMEVVRMVAEGKTNQHIAAMLSITEKTIEKHITKIFGKVAVNSRTELAVYAVREGIVK